MSAIPYLKSFFEMEVEGEGNKRTINLFFEIPVEMPRYESSGGAIIRQIVDFTDPTSFYISVDTGMDQTTLWQNKKKNDMSVMFNNGRLFRLATLEVQD